MSDDRQYEIIYPPSVQKELIKLSKQNRELIIEKVKLLSKEPRPSGVKKLKGDNLYRISISKYRVIYQINDKKLIVLITIIDNRDSVYKKK